MLLFLLLLVAWLGFVNCWRCGYRLRLYGDRYGPCWAWEQKVATAAAAAAVVVCSLQFDKRCTHFECSLTNRRTDWLTDWLALFYRYVLVECSSTGTSDLAQNVLPTRGKMWTATLTWTRTVTDCCLQPNWPANQEKCPADCIVGDDYIHCTKRCKSVYLFCVTNGCNPKKSLAVDFYGCGQYFVLELSSARGFSTSTNTARGSNLGPSYSLQLSVVYPARTCSNITHFF